MEGAAVPHWMAGEDPGFRSGLIHRMYLVKKFMEIINSQQENHYRSLHEHAVRYEQEVDYFKYISKRIIHLEMKLRQTASARKIQQNVCTTPQNSGQVPDQHMASAPNTQIEVNQEQTGMMTVLDHFFNFNSTEVSPVAMPVQLSQRPMQPQSQQHQQAKQLQPTNIAGYNPTNLDQQLQGHSVFGQNFQQNLVLGQNSSGTGTQQRQLAVTQQQQAQLMRMNQQCMTGIQQQNCTQRNQILGVQQALVAKMQIGHPRVQNSQQNVGIECQPMTPPRRQVSITQDSNLVCQSPQTSGPMVSAEEVDWREEIFQKIKSFKDAYLSELLEFDRMVQVPKITKEQSHSLPVETAKKWKRIVEVKKIIAIMLDFLNIQKSNVQKGLQDHLPIFLKHLQQLRFHISKNKARNAEVKTGCQSQNCRQQPQIVNLAGNAAPFTCDASRQQNQQEQQQAIFTLTPTGHQENRGCHLLGVPSPCFSPGPVQPFSTNTPDECFTPSTVTRTGAVQVASPHVTSTSASVKSSVAKPGVVRVISPSASVKSRLASPAGKAEAVHVASPSTSVESTLPSPIAKPATVHTPWPFTPVKYTSQSPLAIPGVVQVDSPRASVTSKLQSPVGKPHTTAQAASPCASVKSTVSLDVDGVTEFLLHGSIVAPTAANGSNQATPTEQLVSAPPPLEEAHQSEDDNVRNGAERMEPKKPISRLIHAMLSSSPEVFRRAANSMRSALWEADQIPLPPLPYRPRDGKIKRAFDHSPLSSTDENCMASECSVFEDESSGEYTAKRHKTQMNAYDALVYEIRTINSKLIDTVISIADENGTISRNGGGTLIKLSYSAMSLAPSLKSLFTASEMPIVMPVKLFVPPDYPKSSPMLVDNADEQRKLSDISHAVAVGFRRVLHELPERRSIEATAMAWDGCVRRAVTEVAHRHGGGTFSSRNSQWGSSMGHMIKPVALASSALLVHSFVHSL